RSAGAKRSRPETGWPSCSAPTATLSALPPVHRPDAPGQLRPPHKLGRLCDCFSFLVPFPTFPVLTIPLEKSVTPAKVTPSSQPILSNDPDMEPGPESVTSGARCHVHQGKHMDAEHTHDRV